MNYTVEPIRLSCPAAYGSPPEWEITVRFHASDEGNGNLGKYSRLITAAPDLLELAHLVRGFLEETSGKHVAVFYGQTGVELVAKARAAIAKVEGR